MVLGMKMISIRRSFFLISSLGCILLISDLTGVHRHFFEKDYQTEFSYPLDVADFPTLIQKYRNHEQITQEPINEAVLNLQYKSKVEAGCAESYRLIILVKSKPENFLQREAIRVTWGFPKRFSDVPIKTVFLLGVQGGSGGESSPLHDGTEQSQSDLSHLQEKIKTEISQHKDIIQGDFPESDDNSTMKLTMGLRWLTETCDKFRYALIVSDDMYVSVKNILKFLRHPAEYPSYWEKQKELDDLRNRKKFHERILKKRSLRDNYYNYKINDLASDGSQKPIIGDKQTQAPKPKKPTKTWKNSPIDFDIDLAEDVVLYSGNVISGPTHRYKIGSKYFLTLDEYPFNQLPPFVSNEAILLSKTAAVDMYFSSLFVKFLRLDDVYLGLCARKLNIEPFHSKYFMLDPSLLHDPYGKDFRYVLTANNFDDPEGLQKFWHGQKTIANA